MSPDAAFGIIIGGLVVYIFYNMKKSGMLRDAWNFIKNPKKY